MSFMMSCNNQYDGHNIGLISSATPEASKAGQQIFLKGGNAIDAAVAVSFALGVTEPAMSGLGGGTQVLLSLNNGQPIAINGTTLSPANTPINIGDTLTYHRRSTIPSIVKVLDYLWRTYGSGNITWEELLNPAIELAENGFKIGKFRAKVYKQYEDKLLDSKFNTSFFLIDGERIPIEGEILKQPILAKTLRRLAEYGADDFYTGEIAKEIAKDMETHGGWITLSDLNNFEQPKELKALCWAESGGKDSLFIRYNNSNLKLKILQETKANITRRGGPEKLLIVQAEDSAYVGKNLHEISDALKISPQEAVFKIVESDHIKVASFNMNHDDIINFMKQSWVVTGSDGNSGHPRKYGTFPRKYHQYVKQEKVIDLASFINGSTSKTAEIFRIPNRGKLEKGYYADIIIFNPESFKDIADYNNAFQLAEGLEYSIINGNLSVENGKFTNRLNGRVLAK